MNLLSAFFKFGSRVSSEYQAWLCLGEVNEKLVSREKLAEQVYHTHWEGYEALLDQIEKHLSSIYRKLDVKNRSQAISVMLEVMYQGGVI